MNTDAQIKQEIQAKGLTAPRITPDDIKAAIASEHYFTAADGILNNDDLPLDYEFPLSLYQVTICVLITHNGIKLVGVNEGPVSPENFDPEMGRQMARKKAVDQLWPMLGYELRTRIASGRTTIADRTGLTQG